MSDGHFLELRGIHKRFGGVHALRGVDVTIDTGVAYHLLGENGCGKTTFIRMLAGLHKADGAEKDDEGLVEDRKGVPPLLVSYKPQKIQPKFRGTVRELLQNKISKALAHTQFQADVVKPMKIDAIIDNEVKTLSGGELQRMGLARALLRRTPILLIGA